MTSDPYYCTKKGPPITSNIACTKNGTSHETVALSLLLRGQCLSYFNDRAHLSATHKPRYMIREAQSLISLTGQAKTVNFLLVAFFKTP